MSQQTFAEASFEIGTVIEPYYPKAEGAGRCIHFLQHWFNLSDPAVPCMIRAMRQFAGSISAPSSTKSIRPRRATSGISG
jgi:hypothetical protein